VLDHVSGEALVGGVVQAEQGDGDRDEARQREGEAGDEARLDSCWAALGQTRPADRVDDDGDGERQRDFRPPAQRQPRIASLAGADRLGAC
jgi:hypothetical protein